MPPTRFRVIERERRLVVIDTLADAAPAGRLATAPRAAALPSAEQAGRLAGKWWRGAAGLAGLSLPTQTRFDGTTTLTTAAWYDDNGPRTVTLDPGAMQMLKVAAGVAVAVFVTLAVLAPALIFTPLTLLLPGVAKPLRESATRWLDRYAE